MITAACAAAPCSAGTYTITQSTRLDALSASLPATGIHHVRFEGEGYRNPGSLTLTNNGCDSLIFERNAPTDTAMLHIQGTLLRVQGQRGTVVLRGLALKFDGGGALFDTSLGGNHELVLDGCTLLGDGIAPAKTVVWSGDGKVSLANCMFTNTGATALSSGISVSIVNSMFVSTGPLTLTEAQAGGGVALFNNLFNFPGVLSVTLGGRMEMWYNTVNRTQFRLDGDSTASFSVHNNYFANPPARNNVPEVGTSRYALSLRPGSFQAAKSVAVDNLIYATWEGFENPAAAPLPGTGNVTATPARDSAVAWDWRIPGDTAHGAWNGNLPLPAFNLFPGDSLLDLPIAGGRAIVAPSPFPLVLRFGLQPGPRPYSAYLPDSVRPWFPKDTLLTLDGKAAVLGLSLPNRGDGVPLLFVPTDAGYHPGPPGPRGGAVYRNAQFKAREFVPALGGQNTYSGKVVASPDPLQAGISMAFATVARAGMTTFGASRLRPDNRKWRKPQYQGRDIAFSAATTAEIEGTVRFGIPASGTTVFKKDSLFFWRGGDLFLPVKDSAGGYWASVPAPLAGLDAMLVERMAFGAGPDSLILPQARIYANSAAGHQLTVDSGFGAPAPEDPAMGAFGAALKFSWPGRQAGDSLWVRFPRSDTLQQAWIRQGSAAVALPTMPGDSRSLRVALAMGDSGRLIFVARKFGIPGGRTVALSLGPDSVLGLYSPKPGDLSLDTAFRPADLDTARLSILAARGIRMDSLAPVGSYTLSLEAKTPQRKDLARALVLINGTWVAASFMENGGRYAITVPPSARAAMMAEFRTSADWAPAQPAAPAAMVLRGDSLACAPALTPAERSALPWFRTDLLSLGPSGDLRMESSRYVPVESSLSVGLAPDRLYAYRVIYRSPLDRFSPDLGWTPLSVRQPVLAALETRIPVRSARFRYLIGFPFDGATVGANVTSGIEEGAGEMLALDTLVSGKWSGLPLAPGTRLERGKGYLLAAGAPFRLKLQGAAFSGLQADTLRFDRPGWHLIANPLPFPFPRSALGIPDSSALSFPRALRRVDTTAGSPAVYDWPVPDTLQPFAGYLVYAFKPTYLAFDPYSAAVRAGLIAASGAPSRAPASKRAAPEVPAPASDAVRMTLSGPGGAQSAVFYRSGPFLQTPYMRPFAEAGRVLEFRAGDGAGWAFRKVDRTDSLRIPLEIVVPEAGVYALTLAGGGPDGDAAEKPDALLDLGSGRVFGAAEMGALTLEAGPHAFILLHGKAAAPGVAAFSAGLPAAFALDQNAPNPFRGSTRIRFRVPGGPGGSFRGRFQVTSFDGRVIESRDLGSLSVGGHELTAGSAGWHPGVYLYEVRLESEKGSRVMRKKMVCGPAGG